MAIQEAGLFDQGPELVQQLLNQQRQAQLMQSASLPPGAGARLLAAQSGGMLGDVVSSALGYENPQIARAKKLQQIKAQVDSSGYEPGTPDYFKEAAKALQMSGFNNEALVAARMSQEAEQTGAKTELLKAQAERARREAVAPLNTGTMPLLGKYVDLRENLIAKGIPEDSPQIKAIDRYINQFGKSSLEQQIEVIKEQNPNISDADATALATRKLGIQQDVFGNFVRVNPITGAGASIRQGGAPGIPMGAPEDRNLALSPEDNYAPELSFKGQGQPPAVSNVRQAPKLALEMSKSEQEAEIKQIYEPALLSARNAQGMIDESKKTRALLSKVETGPFAQIKAKVQNYARAIGINLGDPQDMQSLISSVYRKNWEILNQAKGVQTEGDSERALKASVNLTNVNDANRFINDWEATLAERSQEHVKFLARQRAQGYSYGQAEQMWTDKINRQSIFDTPKMKPWVDKWAKKVPPGHIRYLKEHPEAANDFEDKYGVPASYFLGK